jgi:hypothetical protein
MPVESSGEGSDRLDRMERLLLVNAHDLFRDEHKRLLAAQAVLADQMSKLAEARSAQHMQELADAQNRTDDRLRALIALAAQNRPPQQ